VARRQPRDGLSGARRVDGEILNGPATKPLPERPVPEAVKPAGGD
jgi:hypothetical protein